MDFKYAKQQVVASTVQRYCAELHEYYNHKTHNGIYIKACIHKMLKLPCFLGWSYEQSAKLLQGHRSSLCNVDICVHVCICPKMNISSVPLIETLDGEKNVENLFVVL